MYTRTPAPVVFDLLFSAPMFAAVLHFGYRRGSATEFADGFIQRFMVADSVSPMTRSVSIEQSFMKDEPHNTDPKLCRDPQNQHVTVPKTRIFDEIPAARCDVRKCDLYVFKHSASDKCPQQMPFAVVKYARTNQL